MNWAPLWPIVFLSVMVAVIQLADVFRKKESESPAYCLSIFTTLALTVWFAVQASSGETHYVFSNLAVFDPMAQVLSSFCSLALLVTFVYTRRYLADREMYNGEFYILALFTLLGQVVMISGNNFLTLYLGLELLSLASYALVALRRRSNVSSESGMKYFILGALASGLLLYGMSMLYGATGSLDLGEVFRAINTGNINKTILVFGVVFVVAGLAFKLGAAPFHMWVPDVYQGSPTAVTLLLGAAPKLASFAMMIRILVEGLLPLAIDWQQMLLALAVLSLVIGNLTAIAQTNLKRMLAYSTIAQLGFVLLGMMAGVVGSREAANAANIATAYSASMYYTITYVLTTLGSFGVIMMLARSGHEAEQLADFKGLAKRSPWYALVMTALMFSLAGVPPMMGFMAKWAVLDAVVGSGQLWLAVVAVAASLVGAFYYLRVVKVMWFDEVADASPISTPLDMRVVLSLNGILVVILGILPGPLLAACLSAMSATLKS
jgi:NADH-quinone oxidoreductase subunit N